MYTKFFEKLTFLTPHTDQRVGNVVYWEIARYYSHEQVTSNQSICIFRLSWSSSDNPLPTFPEWRTEMLIWKRKALITISLKKFNYNTNILISSWNKCRLSTIEILHCYLIPYKLLSNMTMMFKAKRNEIVFLHRKSLAPGRSQIVVTNSQFWMVPLSSASTYSTENLFTTHASVRQRIHGLATCM